MSAANRPRAEARGAICALATTLLFFLWLALHVGGHNAVVDFDDIVTALAALAACVACAAAARRQSGAKRRFWTLMAMALAAWTCAEVLWGVYDIFLHTTLSVPSWADVGYLGAIPLAAAALLSHPGMHAPGRNKTRSTLDAVAIGAALIFLSWNFVLGPLWRHTDLTTSGGIVAVAYPFGDLVIIFLIVQSVRSVSAGGRRPLLWVLIGLFAMAVSDSTYAYLLEAGRYATGNLIDTGWVLGYLAIAVGASCDAGARVHTAERATDASLVSFVTPYVPVILALSVITVKLELHQKVDRVSWLSGFGLALVAIARQVLLLVDRHQELFPSPHGPRGPGTGSATNAGSQTVETMPEAGSWPQFLRRSP